jgi:predicted  nucleic acid-binding Zn-ribbon protein
VTHLGSLTDEELISRVRTLANPTPLERELARRLADARDEMEETPEEIRRLEDEIEDLENTIKELEAQT